MKRILLLLLFASGLTACDGFLDVIPDRANAKLTELEQLTQLLNNQSIYTTAPALGDFGADTYQLSFETWNGSPLRIRNAYIWKSDFYEGDNGSGTIQDWKFPYDNIYICNVVLDELSAWPVESHGPSFDQVKAQALFLRAYLHYQLQETFGQPYNPATAADELGIPVRLSSSPEKSITRSTVSETFAAILGDLHEASQLTQVPFQAIDRQKVSLSAVHAMLSRVYLTMQDYQHAAEHAMESLTHYSELLHYSELAPSFQFPFPVNAETIFFQWQTGTGSLYGASSTVIDTVLYQMYDDADLRKRVFFQLDQMSNLPRFNSMYSGYSVPFSGLATDELYLNLAECHVRMGDINGALLSINQLLSHRFNPADFTPVQLTDSNLLLRKILLERRKQLVARATRWTDLRRLNQDARFQTVITRTINGELYTLQPESPLYTYPIPDKEINMSHLPQNNR